MGLPQNVYVNVVGSELVLTTPFHSAVVEWAHQHCGHWDKPKRAWCVPISSDTRDSFERLVEALWPSGVATSEGRAWGPRRATAGSKPRERSERLGSPVSTAGSVETCARCHQAPIDQGLLSNPGAPALPVCLPCWQYLVTYVRQTDAQAAGHGGQSPVEEVAPEPSVTSSRGVEGGEAPPDRRAALRAALGSGR